MALWPTARHVGPRDEVLANAARHAELALRDAIYMFNSGMANAGRPRRPPGGPPPPPPPPARGGGGGGGGVQAPMTSGRSASGTRRTACCSARARSTACGCACSWGSARPPRCCYRVVPLRLSLSKKQRLTMIGNLV
jgi:hypothetical protein